MSFFSDSPAELLYAMPAVGGAVTGTVTTGTAALLSPAGVSVQAAELPHNYFSKVGKSILIEGCGIYTLGTTIPTLKLAVYLDTAVGTPTTLLAGTGAFTADTTSRTAMQFYFRVIATATALGSSGTLQAFGLLNWGMNAGLTTTVVAPAITYAMGAGTTTPVSFATNATTPIYIEPYASWSTSSTGPSITMTNMLVWGLN